MVAYNSGIHGKHSIPKMKKIIVKDNQDLATVATVTKEHFEAKGSVEVVIKNHSESITDAQRGLYWVWTGVIGPEVSNTKLEQHEWNKEHIFLNIYLADPDNHPIFIGIVGAMHIVKDNCSEVYQNIRESVLYGVSHLDATKENWCEILLELEMFANDRQIRLPAPPRSGLI